MRLLRPHLAIVVLVITSLFCVLAGWWSGHLFLGCVAAAVLACLLALAVSLITTRDQRLRQHERTRNHERTGASRAEDAATEPLATTVGRLDADDPRQLVAEMLRQGRAALLLRPQVVGSLTETQIVEARRALERDMALVPSGDVRMQGWRGEAGSEGNATTGRRVHTEALFLDRYPVTNRQFREFVRHGGYRQMSLWDESIWPAVLDFVDATGCPGPRFWRQGTYLAGLEDHPVVGVSWYEALAYSRWVGKRLTSDPEWVKAGCWPVATSEDALQQRKFPWGDTMERQKANLWGTGADQTCSVHDLAEGSSIGGVYHLIGNVWEWTANNFGSWDIESQRPKLKTPMRSLRGGAFDTYFENQANCHFQSGDSPLARKHNIGFRCAISVRDLAAQALSDLDLDSDSGDVRADAGWSEQNCLAAGEVK